MSLFGFGKKRTSSPEKVIISHSARLWEIYEIIKSELNIFETEVRKKDKEIDFINYQIKISKNFDEVDSILKQIESESVGTRERVEMKKKFEGITRELRNLHFKYRGLLDKADEVGLIVGSKRDYKVNDIFKEHPEFF